MIPEKEEPRLCKWIGDNEHCKNNASLYKSYCEIHHSRVYLTMYTEMADYYIEQELKS